MEENIIFLGAVDNSFNYNRTIDYQSKEVKQNIKIGVHTELLFGPTDTNIVGIRFFLLMKHKEEIILNYDVTLTFKVDGWKNKISKLNKEELLRSKEIEQMVEITVGFMRGSLFVQEKNTPLERMNLPILSIPNLLSNIQVIELPKPQE